MTLGDELLDIVEQTEQLRGLDQGDRCRSSAPTRKCRVGPPARSPTCRREIDQSIRYSCRRSLYHRPKIGSTMVNAVRAAQSVTGRGRLLRPAGPGLLGAADDDDALTFFAPVRTSPSPDARRQRISSGAIPISRYGPAGTSASRSSRNACAVASVRLLMA